MPFGRGHIENPSVGFWKSESIHIGCKAVIFFLPRVRQIQAFPLMETVLLNGAELCTGQQAYDPPEGQALV